MSAKEEALKLAYEMDGIEFYDNPNSDPYEWACDAQRMILRLVEELEQTKRKYKNMHNLATQAMSRVHQLEKERSE